MSIKSDLQHKIEFLSTKRNVVVDGDTHPSSRAYIDKIIGYQQYQESTYYQGKPVSVDVLLKEMNFAGVDLCLIWQNPALIQYTENQEDNYQKLLYANRDIFQLGREYPEKFLPAGWTDPKALGVDYAGKLAEILVKEFGFPIVKLNPAQNSYPIDSSEVFTIVEKIISLGAVPAFHFGGDTEFTPPEGLAKIAAKFPESKIIGVHMGGGGSHYVYGDSTYIGAREIGLKHSNIFYTLSAIRDTHIYSNLLAYLQKGGQWLDNLNFGSDAPYGRLSWNFNGFKSIMAEVAEEVDFPDDVKAKFSGNNLLKLYIKTLQNITERNF